MPRSSAVLVIYGPCGFIRLHLFQARHGLRIVVLAHGVHARVPRRQGLPRLAVAQPLLRGRFARPLSEVRATRKFHTCKSRPSYSCDTCGLHVHPTAGTIFHKSATSLHLWFYAMYLMTSTRCAVSAKHIERELGVTYKTAWRMANLIRNDLMDQGGEPPLSGEVEADETLVGGKPRRRATAALPRQAQRRSAALRHACRNRRVRRRRARRARPRGPSCPTVGLPRSAQIDTSVLPEPRSSRTSGRPTTGSAGVQRPPPHQPRARLRQRRRHTNTIEGFFGNLKRGISGNYHSVSPKWLQGYLNEFVWRYNQRRSMDEAMFDARAQDRGAPPWS